MKATITPAEQAVKSKNNIFYAENKLPSGLISLPESLFARLQKVVEERPYYRPGMESEAIQAIVKVAEEMRWIFNPQDMEDAHVREALMEVARQVVTSKTADSKFNDEIARVFALLAKGTNQPGVHATVLNYVPSAAELRGLVVPLMENKKAVLRIFISPEATKRPEARELLNQRREELAKLIPDGRAALLDFSDWKVLYDKVFEEAQKAHQQYYPGGKVGFQTFLERNFVLSLPEEFSMRVSEFDAKLGKGLRSVTYEIRPEAQAKRPAYLVVLSGVAAKFAQGVLSRDQKDQFFMNTGGTHYRMKDSAFEALVNTIWNVFEASKLVSAAA